MSLAKVRKAGRSLVVTLPRELVELIKIRAGEVVELTVRKPGKDYFGALRGIGHFMAEDELKAHD